MPNILWNGIFLAIHYSMVIVYFSLLQIYKYFRESLQFNVQDKLLGARERFTCTRKTKKNKNVKLQEEVN